MRKTLVVLALLLTPLAFAQDSYPSRPIKLIVPFPPGGATDIVGRLMAQKLQEALGQPVVVENKAGAGSNIGSEQVAKAAPDGYTLLLGTIANATNMSIYKIMPYDTLRDFAPVTQTMAAPSVLVVTNALPANNLKELIALAKVQPGKLSFASSGAGGSPHLAGELLKLRAGIDLIHVPYKGAAPALVDVVSGVVSMGFKTALSAIPHMQSGKLKPLAVAATRRLAQIPNVPTMAEAGLPDFEVSSWNGVLAPARTPPEVIARLNQELVRILATQDVKDRFAAQAAEPVGSTPEQFRAYIRSEIDKWAQVVRASGAKID
ncbi:MAG: tripartite tricarboxylate transporter substrate binding protein [Betaproteobacteria bacterium]|nr:tripartite tricarboxylate transporter substrate binding protein [Betaproteobacteria bacterium]